MKDLLHESPIAISLESLLDEGLSAVMPDVLEALREDDFSAALKRANQHYADRGAKDLDATLTYAILLSHRHLGEEALGVLKRAIEFHSHTTSLQLAQADALIARDQPDAAEALLEGLAQVTFTNPRHLAYLGDLFMELGNADGALEVYGKSLDGGYMDAGVAISIANIYLERDQHTDAARAYETAGRFAARDPFVWVHAGDAWMVAAEFSNAANAYGRATKIKTNFEYAWTHLGYAEAESGEFEQALRAFKRAQRLKPMDLLQWLNIGHTQLELGLPEEARQSYLKVVEDEEGQVEAIHGLTAAAFELGDVEMAERMARRAVELDPDNPDSHYNLGVILLSMHRAEGALACFESASASIVDEPRYLFSAAVAIARLGRPDEALERATHACQHLTHDATPVFEFARDIASLVDSSQFLAFIAQVNVDDPRWVGVRSMFEFLVHALRRSEDGQAQRVAAFLETLQNNPKLVPVMWDFDEIERLILGLEPTEARMVETMIAVLEGRKDVGELQD